MVNNPVLSVRERQDAGIRMSADPDFCIEGFVFDCYTPDPPLIARSRAQMETRALWEIDSPSDLLADYDGASTYAIRTTKRLILDSIRDHISNKLHERQAFNMVINLTEVAGDISPNEVASMLWNRRLEKLEHAFLVTPTPLARRSSAKWFSETINRKEFGINEVYSWTIFENHGDFEILEIDFASVKSIIISESLKGIALV